MHWASRLYQNLLLALWGERVIVHTMGGDIDSKQDFKGKKKRWTQLLLRYCRVITIKSRAMREMLSVCDSKIHYLSWGVEDRFLQKTTKEEQLELQHKLYGREFDYLFFSIRAFGAFYQQKEIMEAFLQNFRNNSRIGLLVSLFRKDEEY